MTTPSASPNFAYLAYHDPKLVLCATAAEQLFAVDAVACLTRLRLFGELLAQRAAAKLGCYDPQDTQHELISKLSARGHINAQQRELFHGLRHAGNQASHHGVGDHQQALHQLRMARELAAWFQRSFGNNKKFDPGPFVPPPDPAKADTALQDELDRLKKERDADKAALSAAAQQVVDAQKAADEAALKVMSAEQLAAKKAEDIQIMEALVLEQTTEQASALTHKISQNRELQAQVAKLQADLLAVQQAAVAAPLAVQTAIAQAAKDESENIVLDEHATRMLIDQQLRAAGWDVDSDKITFKRGVRPQKGRNVAIAEWPTRFENKDGRADYVLFAGLTAIAVVEAKRKHKNISGNIPQAQRYSKGYLVHADEAPPEGSPWGDHKIPFVFATNGRPFIRQHEQQSGIWFLDARRAVNHPRALDGWYTPQGLLDLLRADVDTAHAQLAVEPMPYIEREFQRRAILAVEDGLRQGKQAMLLAMATGTGKTRTCIGLCYRLLKTRRFRRVLFLVDRTSLGDQTLGAFKTLPLEQLQTFTQIFDVKELGDLKPASDTRLHVATIQAMVRRIIGPHDEKSEATIPPVDEYDCIIVDECHRGYLLDREMSEHEQQFRDEAEYISNYRRVLDHFDSVKIGLTATPALHTTEIFGKPVYTYSYREAVIDGFLVDHDPPIRIVTKLSKDGIHYKAHEEVTVLDKTKQLLLPEILPDDVSFEIEHFNKTVITEEFTKAVLGEVARHIDPSLPEKTLIFCVDDKHADSTVDLLKKALAAEWGAVDNEAVAKITGASDLPLTLIKKFRVDKLPSFGVTVDLLTTGIDVPAISNLVFLRRVRSRILYEQMLGRATRLCPEIGKERFRIFDAVDLYAGLKDVSTMKPVVVNPSVTFAQLVVEVLQSENDDHRKEAIEELIGKLQRKKRALDGEVADKFETAAGMSLTDALGLLRGGDSAAATSWLRQRPLLGAFLDSVAPATAYKPVISTQLDGVHEVVTGYGKHKKPEDYLESFHRFVTENINLLPGLMAVVDKPRDLKRADLKALRLTLDQAGYSEAYLQSAFKESRNEDIAASIIGFIRQSSLGSPLIPYGERVDRGVRRYIQHRTKLTEPQKKWLLRIAKQLKKETVVDRDSFDDGAFAADGGFAHLNKAFGGELENVLGDVVDQVWSDTA